MELYPFKFEPILKDRLWGGTKLTDLLKKPKKSGTIGESWEVSTVKENISVISNGVLKGTSLQDIIERNAEELLGKSVVQRFGKNFPILIKFIDAKLDLSIQLHPDDALAKSRHDSFGKTEMWYIMDAEPKAELIIGFNKDVDKKEYAESLEKGTLLNLLNYEKVQEGDTFLINTGKIHAIGAGVMLAEIQQTSDITYRVFDFDRKDKNGNLRELHTELALDAIDYRKKDDFKVAYHTTENKVNTMVNSPYFVTNFLHLTKNIDVDISKRDSFTIFMCVAGEVLVHTENGEITLKKGETTLIPAITKHINLVSKEAKLLEVTI